MTDKNSIRLLWRQGDSVAEVERKTGVSRDTVQKTPTWTTSAPSRPRGGRRAQSSTRTGPLIES